MWLRPGAEGKRSYVRYLATLHLEDQLGSYATLELFEADVLVVSWKAEADTVDLGYGLLMAYSCSRAQTDLFECSVKSAYSYTSTTYLLVLLYVYFSQFGIINLKIQVVGSLSTNVL